MGLPPPDITAVISTRNRGERVAQTLRSVLANDHPRFAVIVVDQSDDDASERALAELRGDARVDYVRSATRGHSVSRNLGTERARSDLVAYTDDDCEVPSSWLRDFQAAFAVDPRIGMIFGNVMPGPHDPALGFVPAYVRTEPFLATGIQDKHRLGGMGACMGARRSVWQATGGFDQNLGIGTRFNAGEDSDLAVRCLLAGYHVYETPAVHVLHHGFRTWEQGQSLIHSYWYSTGAMFVKNFRLHPIAIGMVLVRLGWNWAFSRSLVAASLGKNPYRLKRLASFLRGFGAGAVVPVDRARGLYTRPSPPGEYTRLSHSSP